MKIVEKNTSWVPFAEVKNGEVFKTDNLGYCLKIEDVRGYDDDEDEEIWLNAVSLFNGEVSGLLDCEEVERVSNCEFVVL